MAQFYHTRLDRDVGLSTLRLAHQQRVMAVNLALACSFFVWVMTTFFVAIEKLPALVTVITVVNPTVLRSGEKI